MKKIVLLCVMLIFVVLLCSCGSSQTPPVSPDVENEAETEASMAPETTPALSHEFISGNEQEMLRVLTAGKQFLTELQEGVEPSGKSEWISGAAVEAFGRFFEPETLYVSGVFMNPNTPDVYTCLITGYNAYNYARTVNVNFTVNEPMIWSCDMVAYYEQSDKALSVYLRFLQDDNASDLARWFALDAGEPGDELITAAKDTLAYYHSFCDLSELTIRENDYRLLYDEVYIRGFGYTIEDANGVTFEVEMRFGDGLCYPVLPNGYKKTLSSENDFLSFFAYYNIHDWITIGTTNLSVGTSRTYW